MRFSSMYVINPNACNTVFTKCTLEMIMIQYLARLLFTIMAIMQHYILDVILEGGHIFLTITHECLP